MKKKVRKICFEITPRRILGTILVAATLVNLVIVGAAFEASAPTAVPTMTETQTTPAVETALLPPTLSGGNLTLTPQLPVTGATETPSSTPTETTTSTSTATVTSTPTSTPTSTVTSTPSPRPTLCTPDNSWPVYVVKNGDTLSAIGQSTGTTVTELMQANCLTVTLIYPGQELRVRRLPIDTPTYTATTPSDTPTEFKLAEIMTCDAPYYVSVAVIASDPQVVVSVIVRFYTKSGSFVDELIMQPQGETYFVASGLILEKYTVYDIDSYSFVARDRLQNVTVSPLYSERSPSCIESQNQSAQSR